MEYSSGGGPAGLVKWHDKNLNFSSQLVSLHGSGASADHTGSYDPFKNVFVDATSFENECVNRVSFLLEVKSFQFKVCMPGLIFIFHPFKRMLSLTLLPLLSPFLSPHLSPHLLMDASKALLV
jgi:hypothetical protein